MNFKVNKEVEIGSNRADQGTDNVTDDWAAIYSVFQEQLTPLTHL